MSKNHKAPHPFIDIDFNRPVELIAGPECGRLVQWPHGKGESQVKYHGGFAKYSYEANQKAVYVEG